MTIDPATALRITKADPECADMVNEVLVKVNGLIHPSSTFRIVTDFTIGEDCIEMEGRKLSCGKKVAMAMAGATGMAVFAMTIGDGLSELYAEYAAQMDYLSAYWCDLLANHAVNTAMEELKETVRAAQTDGKITSNWGPGYCGWPLTDQSILLSLLPEEDRCVSLSEAMLMRPSKSLSGLIGIGKDVVYHKSGCADCFLEHCAYKNNRV